MKKLLGPKNWHVTLSLLIALVCVSALALLLCASQPTSAAQMMAPQADVIATYNFDDGTTQGWGPRGGGVVVTATTEAARSGTYSIKVTGRTSNWHGASINMLGVMEVGATYAISGCTRLVAGQASTNAIFTMQKTVGGDQSWDTIATASNVTDADWTCALGTFTYAAAATELTLYVESPVTNTEYYIDDVAIVMTVPPPGVYKYNFDDGTTQGWGPRGGGVVVTATTEAARSGTYSLKVTGRSDGWHGASIDLLGVMEVGATYAISGCTRLVAGQASTNAIFTMQKTVGGDQSWDTIATASNVTDADWTCALGTFTYAAAATELTLYVESPVTNTEYYIDDVAIIMTSAPPVGPVEEIARYDFDDDTTQGWEPRGTGVTVTVTTEAAASAPNSLKVTGRSDTIHGAQIDLTSVLQPNVTYEISGCVRLVEGQPGDRLVFTMQRNPAGVITPTYTWIASPIQVTTTAWACINAQYSFADADQLILYVESREGPTTEFYVDDVVILRPTQLPIQRDIPSLYQELSSYFLVGAAIEPDQLDSIRHTELLTRHFNSLTAENAMKPASIQPTEGTFNWAGADRLTQFARDHNMYVHGHTLEWHEQVPDWFFEVNGEPMTPTLENKQLLLDRLETHIRAVAGRYKDDVNVWDAVNEVIDQSQPDCLRRNTWYEITGRDYISLAFTVANEVVPTATLILNDYGTTEPLKRQCIYRVVGELLDAGIPVEGIGMQKHINIQNPTPAAIEETIELFGSLGVEVHITELDMSIYTSDSAAYATAADVPEDVLIAQGYRYKELFEVFKRQAAHIGSVTFWGLSDDHTWLTNRPITRVDMPMPFDQQQQAKHAYWGIIDPSRLPVFIKQDTSAWGTPTIDGNAESLWTMLPWKDVQPATEEFTATFQTRWDATHLYLFLNVAYPERSAGGTAHLFDAIDVFIDEGNEKAGAYGADDWHYRFQGSTYIPVVPFDAPQFEIVTSTTGYRLEAAFPLSATAAIDDLLGFDIRLVNGNYPSTYISWNDLQHTQNISTTSWGSLTLVGEYKLTTALQGTPVIDALEDTLWADTPEVSTNVWVAGTSGSTARVKTMWDDAHLYIYAVVSDSLLSDASSNAWEQDSVEAFVDQNNSKVTTYEDDDGQFRVNFNNVQSFRGAAASADTLDSATRILTGTGYVVEMAITLNDFPPQLNGLIGFDFQVNNDQDGNGTRDSVAMWNDPTGQSYQNTSRLGVLQFVARTVTAPVADFSATPTSGDAPLAVTFTDLSTNDPATWQWAFGDGGTSTLQNPVHTYTTPGVYTVTLTAGNTAGSDTEVKASYITVLQPVYRLYLPLAMKNS